MSHPRPSSQPPGLPFPKGEGAAATPANPRAQAGGGGQGWAAARAWDLGRAYRAPAPSPGGRVPGNGQQCAVWPEDPHAPHRRSRQHRSQSRGVRHRSQSRGVHQPAEAGGRKGAHPRRGVWRPGRGRRTAPRGRRGGRGAGASRQVARARGSRTLESARKERPATVGGGPGRGVTTRGPRASVWVVGTAAQPCKRTYCHQIVHC